MSTNAKKSAAPQKFDEKDVARRKEDFIEQIEKDYNSGKLIKADELLETHPKLHSWLTNIGKYGNVDRTCLIFRKIPTKLETPSDDDSPIVEMIPDVHNIRIRVYFFTTDHKYSISVRLPYYDEENDDFYKGYLGCIASTRKNRVGETWTRGSDLANGSFSKKTWDNIIGDIISHEMKNLQVNIADGMGVG